jgi:hypothetical protein
MALKMNPTTKNPTIGGKPILKAIMPITNVAKIHSVSCKEITIQFKSIEIVSALFSRP